MSKLNPLPTGAQSRQQALRRIRRALLASDPDADPQQDRKDRQAYILEQLEAISQSVAQTTAAWEKRHYWVKAERLLAEWAWVRPAADRLGHGLAAEDETLVADALADLTRRLVVSGVKQDPTLQPAAWRGAWERRADGPTRR